ncbi:Rieske (2Fe-2S) protein [Streptomyces sp. CB03238]|uniref:Rieske (2Fe-2S) protein n=1 Tax=Streptomyces sp. CB03238 TaxID=1907777 RepID=UPI000A1081CF|nr:Rieske (2Fe-2S) protein [Streptomyces sp. CB03238]ORT60139.1 iron sulfur protein [Streptomyces sp. CB03238]
MTSTPTPRRTVLAAAASATAALVGGCGDGNGAAPPATATSPTSPTGPAPELARTADIPAGGGRIFKDRKVVVTQPQEGEFTAFSAVCTHQACLVATVEDGTINCACHGSRFRIADGSVARGPATRPLPAERITVTGDSIRLT